MNELVRLVAQREISTKLRDRAFLVATGFLLVIVAASVAVPLAIERFSGRDEHTVATVGADAAAVLTAAARFGDLAAGSSAGSSAPALPDARLTALPVDDVAAAETAVRDGRADAALVPAEGSSADTLALVGDSSVPSAVTTLVSRALGQARLDDVLAGSGVSAGSVTTALEGATPAVRLLDGQTEAAPEAIGVGLVFTLLFFFTVFSFGMGIATTVTQEKESRVVELLVTAVPVRSLLLGKVLGNAALALGQVAVLLAVGLAGAAVAGQGELVSVLLRSSGWFVGFFVLGFVMLACLWAAAGALASRQEDLQSTTVPLQVLVMGPFFASVYIFEPGRWMTVLSYLPFTSPLMMPRRIALGDASWWEGLASAGLVVVTAAVLILVGARIYEGSLLRTATRVGWRQAWTVDR